MFFALKQNFFIHRTITTKQRLNRIRIRASRRGLLELEILLNKFLNSKNELDFLAEEIDDFEKLLDFEDVTLVYDSLTGKKKTPDDFSHNQAFRNIIKYMQDK